MDSTKVTGKSSETENKTTHSEETLQTENGRNKKKPSKKTIILIAAAVLLCAVVVLIFTLIIPTVKYNDAAEMLEQDMYEDAKLIFTELGNFKDSLVMIDECGYQEATDLLAADKYDAAHNKFIEMGEYKDSSVMADESSYQKALNQLSDNLFDDAIALFESLGEYSDSVEMIKECDYQRGHYLLEQDEYFEARKMFSKLDDYKDSETMINEVLYVKGNDCMAAEDYNTAIRSFRGLKARQYKNSEELLNKAYYAKGGKEHEEGNYYIAFDAYNAIPEYLDVQEKLKVLTSDTYDAAVALYRKKDNYNDAERLFKLTEGYESTEDYMTLLMLGECNDFMSANDMKDRYNGDELYDKLRALIGFENADEIIMNDIWIKYFLKGKWALGRKYLNFYETRDQKKHNEEHIYIYLNLTDNLGKIRGKYYKIEDGILYGGDNDKGWNEQYQIKYIDYDTIEIYKFSNESTLTITRR